MYIVTLQRQHHRPFQFIWDPSQTLQTLHNDSLTTANLVHYTDDKGVEMILTGCYQNAVKNIRNIRKSLKFNDLSKSRLKCL